MIQVAVSLPSAFLYVANLPGWRRLISLSSVSASTSDQEKTVEGKQETGTLNRNLCFYRGHHDCPSGWRHLGRRTLLLLPDNYRWCLRHRDKTTIGFRAWRLPLHLQTLENRSNSQVLSSSLCCQVDVHDQYNLHPLRLQTLQGYLASCHSITKDSFRSYCLLPSRSMNLCSSLPIRSFQV